MTPAERKRRQRWLAAQSSTATAEAIDATVLRVFKDQCRYLEEGLVRRELGLSELADLVARAFPAEERAKVYDRVGFHPDRR